MMSRLIPSLPLMEIFITAFSPVISTQQNFAVGRRLKFYPHLPASSWFTLVAIPEGFFLFFAKPYSCGLPAVQNQPICHLALQSQKSVQLQQLPHW